MVMRKTVILTSYFSNKPHPNDPRDMDVVGRESDGRVKKCDFSYIERWYESVNVLDVDAVVFYDNLTDDFIQQYQNDKIRFIKAEESIWGNLDMRWFEYLKFLKNHKYENVFFNDVSDVTVVKDPAGIFDEFPEVDLFVCNDSIPLKHFAPYLQVHQHFGWPNYFYMQMQAEKDAKLLNMGVIGAKYNTATEFLQHYHTVRHEMRNPEFAAADMSVGQYVIRVLMHDKRLLVGEPFTSEYKKHQRDREDVYFIHK